MSRKGKLLPAVGVLTVMITIGACSSTSKSNSSSPTSSGQSTNSAGAAQPTGAPIKVGLVCACTGNAFGASIVPSVDTYKAWSIR